MRINNKYYVPKEDQELAAKLSKDFQLNKDIRELYQNKDFKLEFSGLSSYSAYSKLAGNDSQDDRLLNLKKQIEEIRSRYKNNYSKKLTFNRFVFYLCNAYSELEQSPFRLKKRYIQEIALFLLSHLSQLRSQKQWSESVKKKIYSDRDKFKALFPRKYQIDVFNKALQLCMQSGFAVALSFLKLVEHKPHQYEKIPPISLQLKRGRIWIAINYYDEVDDVRMLLSGDNWKQYKKLLRKRKLIYKEAEIRRAKGIILVSLPTNINNSDEKKKVISKIWAEVSMLQKEIISRSHPDYKLSRQIRDFPVTYRAILLKRKNRTGQIAKTIYGEHSSTPTIRYIIDKRS